MNSPSPQYTIGDLQAAAPRVLERLRALADLPQYGTVAGQSVASLFWEELGHPCRGPVNDIDVFVNMNLPRPLRGLEEIPEGTPYNHTPKYVQTAAHMNDIGGTSESYSHVKFLAVRMTTNILRTYQVGLLNYTLIHNPIMKPSEIGHSIEVSRALIEGFDLNLVSVAINLESGEVAASPGFLEFLNTRKIKAETCNTPAHTLVRLAHKVFGGQVSGAECDYDNERLMLEAAIACQTRTKDAPFNPHYLSTVLHFGGCKYKSLHERYEDKLPPTEKILSDDGSYAFYALTPTLAQTGLAKGLIEKAQGNKGRRLFPECVLQTIFVSKFPEIFRLYQEDGAVSTDVARRRAAFEAIDIEKSEAHNIRCLQAALGTPQSDIVPVGMDESEAALFFFGQESGKSEALAARAAEVWEDLSPIEQAVVAYRDIRADDVLGLGNAKEHPWKDLLARRGDEVLTGVAGAHPKSKEGREDCHRFLEELLDTLEHMGSAAKRTIKELLPEGTPFSEKFRTVIGAFTGEDQPRIAGRLATLLLPGWPDASGVSPPEARMIAMQFSKANVPLPDEFVKTLPQGAMYDVIEGVCQICREKLSRSPSDKDLSFMRQSLPGLIDRASDAQLAQENATLIRALMCLGQGDVLIETLRRRAGSDIGRAIDLAMEHLRENTSLYPAYVSGEDPWAEMKGSAAAIAVLQNELLLRSTMQASAPRRTIRI